MYSIKISRSLQYIGLPRSLKYGSDKLKDRALVFGRHFPKLPKSLKLKQNFKILTKIDESKLF